MLRGATVGSLDTSRLGGTNTRQRLCGAIMHSGPRSCSRRPPLCKVLASRRAAAAGAASPRVSRSAPTSWTPAVARPPKSGPARGERGWGKHGSSKPQRTELPWGHRRQAVARKRPDAPPPTAACRDGARVSVDGMPPPRRRGGGHHCAAAVGGAERLSRNRLARRGTHGAQTAALRLPRIPSATGIMSRSTYPLLPYGGKELPRCAPAKRSDPGARRNVFGRCLLASHTGPPPGARMHGGVGCRPYGKRLLDIQLFLLDIQLF